MGRFGYDQKLARRIGLVVFAALGIAIIIGVLVAGARKGRPVKPQVQEAVAAISLEGSLRVVSADTFAIGKRQFNLCGITEKNPANRDLTTSLLQSAYNGRTVRCTQSGGGTTCDGLTSPVHGAVPQMQCFDEDNGDIGARLIERGLFCGTIDAPGYKRC